MCVRVCAAVLVNVIVFFFPLGFLTFMKRMKLCSCVLFFFFFAVIKSSDDRLDATGGVVFEKTKKKKRDGENEE